MDINHIYENAKKKFTAKTFFEYNRDKIFSQISPADRLALATELKKKVEELKSSDIKYTMTLPCPCILYLESKYATYELIIRHTNFQVEDSSVIAFEDKKIQETIEEDVAYNEYDYAIKDDGKKTGETRHIIKRETQKFLPGCRVIGWFKSQNYYGKKKKKNNISNIYDVDQTFADISPYVINLNTQVSQGGGQFNLTLPHIPLYKMGLNGGGVNEGEWQDAEGGKHDGYTKSKIQTNNIIETTDDGGYYAKSKIDASDYFDWLISPNDLLFIAFHSLPELKDTNSIAKQNFDMIALVDSVSLTKDATGSVSVSVSGKDLMKLINEDNSLFFPMSVTCNNKEGVFDNTESVHKGGDTDSIFTINKGDNEKIARFPISGSLMVFAEEPNGFTIDSVIKTVVRELVNLQIVPDDTFTAWGDERTKFSDLTPVNK